MKHHIKIIFLLSVCLCLEGCMEAAIRFWNGPGWSSPARNKADHECFEELELTLPDPNDPRVLKQGMNGWLTFMDLQE